VAPDWEVEILDCQPLVCGEGGELDTVTRFLEAVSAPVLGISVTALSLPAVLASWRRLGPRGQRLILGGPGVQGLPAGFLSDFPEVDVAVAGEGELALAAALRFFDGSADSIPGAWYRDRGEIFARPQVQARLPSLDLVPPVSYPISPAADGRNLRILMESSRGCPFRCSFCSSPGAWGNVVTTRSATRLVAELRSLADHLGPLETVFVDDLFTLSRQRVLAFCSALKESALPVQWACFGRIETVDAELLHSMAAAGCQAVSFGIEAGNDRVLRRLGKTFTREQVRRVLGQLHGIVPVLETSFIRGFPFARLEEFSDTLELMEDCHELGCHVKLYTLTPLLGTRLHGEFEGSWRWSPHYRNPSLQTWAVTEDPEMAELFGRYPYLACPFGYYDYPEREAKEAMNPGWVGRLHALAGRPRQ